MPLGTGWMRVIEVSAGTVAKLGAAHNVTHWDQYMDLDPADVKKTIAEQLIGGPNTQWDQLMLDMEGPGLLRPADLRRQSWYPVGSGPAAQKAFEEKYYDGYALVECLFVDAARVRATAR